ncbi:MAG: hypothetical protein KAS04_05680, partial [Candidatus Aenigmarchaeota archaeon]|nr:hypothetical protein [Candidatus Aenigmarchaeota archaeon]
MKHSTISCLVVFLFILSATIVVADLSDVPHQFYGDVTINSVPAPDGVLVIAKFNDNDVESGLTQDGKYGYEYPAFIVSMHPQYVGQTVEFYVGNVKAGEAVFSEGATTELHLLIGTENYCGDQICLPPEDCSSCPADCGECPPSPPIVTILEPLDNSIVEEDLVLLNVLTDRETSCVYSFG